MKHTQQLEAAARERFNASQIGEADPATEWWCVQANYFAKVADALEVRIEHMTSEIGRLRDGH